MNPKFKDVEIYKKAKAQIDKEHKKHSAYKSMALIKLYKSLGGRIDESKSKGGTQRWLKEKWVNLTPVAMGLSSLADSPACGVKHLKQGNNPSICRPKIKVNEKTPKVASTYTKTQLKKALDIKKKGKTINWGKL